MSKKLANGASRWLAGLLVWTLIVPANGLAQMLATPTGDGEFAPHEHWLTAFGRSSGGWNENYPRVAGDVNGDGMDDIVGFSSSGTYLSLSTGSGFGAPQFAHEQFGANFGWQRGVHPRWLGDVNGDGRDDLVGFSNGGVLVALSEGTRFGPANQWLAAFGLHSGGWGEQNPRILGDVNGDGLDDIVGFGAGGTYLSLATGSGFTPAQWVSGEFGTNHGWQTDVTPRWLGDVNGDGREDIVGFASGGTLVALSNGVGFEASTLWLSAFGLSTGGWGAQYPRVLGDANGDGLDDVIGFASTGTFVAFSNGERFEPAQLASDQFGTNTGWQTHVHPRWAADADGNGQADIVGFSEQTVVVARADFAVASVEPPPTVCDVRLAAPASVDLLFSSFGASEDDEDFVAAFDFDRNGVIDAADLDSLRIDLTGEDHSCPIPGPTPDATYDPATSAEPIFCSNAVSISKPRLSIAGLPTGLACATTTIPGRGWLWNGGMGEVVGTTIDTERIKEAVDRARAAGRTIVSLEEIHRRLQDGREIDRELLADLVKDLREALGDQFPKLVEMLEALEGANDLVDKAEEVAQLVIEVIDFINRIEEAQNDPVKAAELFVDYLRMLKWIAETFGGPVGQVASAFLEQFAELLDNATETLDEIQRRTQENRQAGLDFVNEALGSGGTPNDQGQTPFDEFQEGVGEGPPPIPTPDTRTELEKAEARAKNRFDEEAHDVKQAEEAVEQQQEKVDELEEIIERDKQRREELGERPDPIETLDDNDRAREIDALDDHIEMNEGVLERLREWLETLKSHRDSEQEEADEAKETWRRLREILDDVEHKRRLRLEGANDQQIREAREVLSLLIPPAEAFCNPDHEAWVAYDAYWSDSPISATPAPTSSTSNGEPTTGGEAGSFTDPVAQFGDPIAFGVPQQSDPATTLSDPIVLSEPAPSLSDPISLGGSGTGGISLEPEPEASTSGFTQPWTLGLF